MTSKNRRDRVELVVSDMNGVPRGKTVAAAALRVPRAPQLPASVFFQTITGDYADALGDYNPADEDLVLSPVPGTRCAVPCRPGVEQTLCATLDKSGSPSAFDPRNALARVVDAFACRGLRPLIAPEIEFYLLAGAIDPNVPLRPASGVHGVAEDGSEAFGLDSLSACDSLLDAIASCYEEIELAAAVHEMGPAQFELNVPPAEALACGDRLVLLKRAIRACARQAGSAANFMAKPLEGRPGSGLHIHASVYDAGGNNIFALHDDGANAPLRHFIGGMQRHLPSAFALIAPHVNSYRRFVQDLSAPVNFAWGIDNRTTALRVPFSAPADARVENRLPGADANPYLAVAATLCCGLLGLADETEPAAPVAGDAYELPVDVPRELQQALDALPTSAVAEVLGKPLVDVFRSVKQSELDAWRGVVSPWERAYLGRAL